MKKGASKRGKWEAGDEVHLVQTRQTGNTCVLLEWRQLEISYQFASFTVQYLRCMEGIFSVCGCPIRQSHQEEHHYWETGFSFAVTTSFTPLELRSLAVNISVFIILIIETFFCSPPWASSPSDPAGCRDNAKHSPPQQQQHSTGEDLELCKYWLGWLSWARNGREWEG